MSLIDPRFYRQQSQSGVGELAFFLGAFLLASPFFSIEPGIAPVLWHKTHGTSGEVGHTASTDFFPRAGGVTLAPSHRDWNPKVRGSKPAKHHLKINDW